MEKNSSPKIIISLMGGLGNQMFQYSLYKWFLFKGCNAFLDAHRYNLSNIPSHEKVKLHYFDIKDIRLIDFKEASKYIDFAFIYKFKLLFNLNLSVFSIFKAIILKIYRKITRFLLIKPGTLNCFVTEKPKEGFGCIKNLRIKSNTYIYGTFTYSEPLEDIKQSLINDFSFNKDLPSDIKFLIKGIKQKESVAIHVRRGDFAGDKIRDVCSLNYYRNAAQYLTSKHSDLVFYIFSNDAEYIKANFFFLGNYSIIDNSSFEHPDYFDLFLMTQVKYLIISNSTFSYWGAWLNQNQEKIVIAPEKYHLDNSWVPPEELYPASWIKMAVD